MFLALAQILWGFILAIVVLAFVLVALDYQRWSHTYDDTCCWGCTPDAPVAPCTLHT